MIPMDDVYLNKAEEIGRMEQMDLIVNLVAEVRRLRKQVAELLPAVGLGDKIGELGA